MARNITLGGPPASTVPKDVADIHKLFDLLGEREEIRQNKQRISNFISENIRLTAENEKLQPESRLSPDEISQQAALKVTEAEPEFAKGLLGGIQRFAGGLRPGPSTTLTGPIAKGLLDLPTGLRKDLIKAQIEATRGLATSRVGTGKAAKKRKRDAALRVIQSDKSTPTQVNEAKDELLTGGLLAKINESPEEVDKEFSKIMKGKKRIRAKGNILDKKFGEEAFGEGLKEAIEAGFEEGVHPESITENFEKWWDAQFAEEKGQPFQKFQDRAEFQDVDAVIDAEKKVTVSEDLSVKIEAALKAGTITQDDKKSIESGLAKDPSKQQQVLDLISKKEGG